MAAEHEIELAGADGQAARRAAAAAIADVQRIEAKYSRYRDDSVTSRINARRRRRAGRHRRRNRARCCATPTSATRRASGLFDITSGVLRRAWDFRREPPVVPDRDALAQPPRSSAGASVEWDARCVRLPRAGMEIDFGGIGKEYAADRVGDDLPRARPAPRPRQPGRRHPRHRAAGATARRGASGIRHPRMPKRGDRGLRSRRPAHSPPAATTSASSTSTASAIATSSIRRTGMPVTHWQSVSVAAPLCVVAGSCATIAMLLEADGAPVPRGAGRAVARRRRRRQPGAACRLGWCRGHRHAVTAATHMMTPIGP